MGCWPVSKKKVKKNTKNGVEGEMRLYLGFCLGFAWVFIFAGCSSGGAGLFSAEPTAVYAPMTTAPAPAVPTPTSQPQPTPTFAPDPTDAPALTTSPPEVVAARLTHPSFSNRWAITDKHFFVVSIDWPYNEEINPASLRENHVTLYRLPLDDISQAEIIRLPYTNEIDIMGVDIVGICARYLYVSRTFWPEGSYVGGPMFDNCDVYKICLETLEATKITRLYTWVAPFYHAAGNSFLFTASNRFSGTLLIQRFCLDTDTWFHVYFIDDLWLAGNMDWIPLDNGGVRLVIHTMVSGSTFIYICPQLTVQRIDWWQMIHELPADMFDWQPPMMLRYSETETIQVQYLHGQRFGIVGISRYLQDINGAYMRAVRLSESGEIIKQIGSGWEGHNSSFIIEAINGTDLVMTVSLWGFNSGRFIYSVYCTRTGALFIP
ncbi:MAG: hypothetical protein FWC71_10905 [Defluviitaleaceae bacterium]|nr:hypothetical protein [Defluviitaleaceae bacterium]